MKRDRAFLTLRSIQAEFDSARFCITYSLHRAAADPAILRAAGLSASQLRTCAANIDTTYLVRLFAHFEAVLRDHWSQLRPTEPPMRDLLEALAARCNMPAAALEESHEVRGYRNAGLHEGESSPRLAFPECRARLARYLAYLPRDW